MSSDSMNRRRLTQLLIAIGVVVGGYMFLVEPQRKKFDDLDARVRLLSTQMQEDPATPHVGESDVSRQVIRLREMAREVEEGNRPFLDATALYEHITGLAERNRIELGPFSPRHREATRDAPAALSLRLAVAGTYEDLASFVDALQYEAGFGRLTELNFRAIGDREQPRVRASIQIDFLHFEVPSALASLMETSDARN